MKLKWRWRLPIESSAWCAFWLSAMADRRNIWPQYCLLKPNVCAHCGEADVHMHEVP